MSKANKSKSVSANVKTTMLDLKIAKAFYPILIELATTKTTLQYKQLVEKTKSLHPNDAQIQNMIAVRSGRVLGVIYRFAEFNNLPRISTLIVGKGGECGRGITEGHNAQIERENCYQHDWTNEIPKFWEFINSEEVIVNAKTTKKPSLSITHARDLVWDFYKQNKSNLIASVSKFRDLIAKQIVDGASIEDAFKPYWSNNSLPLSSINP